MEEGAGNTFAEAMDSFLIFAERVLSYAPSGVKKVNDNSSNKLKIALGYYKNVFNKTRESKKHVKLFSEIYKACRGLMMEYPEIDQFMSQFMNKIFVVKISENSDSKIYLSAIFRYCTRIASEADDRYEKGVEGALEDPAMTYPESFMLHLFRLFMFCASESDKTELLVPKIEILEKSLNLRPNEVPQTGGSGFEKLIQFSTNLAREIGMDVPNINDASIPEIENMMSRLTSDKKMKDMVKKVIGNVNYKDPSKLQDVFFNLASMLNETAKNPSPELNEAMMITSESQQK